MEFAVYTFSSPYGMDETSKIIQTTVESMRGKAKVITPGRIEARWKTQPYHSKQFSTMRPSKFTFYVGNGLVRVIGDACILSHKVFMRFNLTGQLAVWNAFIESLQKVAPGVDFGIRPGDLELVAVQLVGDGTEEVFVSATRTVPSWGGAALGSLLFGTAGAIIGASAGTSYTTGKTTTRFSGTMLARGRYSNGLLAEATLSTGSPAYQEILVNMSQLSDMTETP